MTFTLLREDLEDRRNWTTITEVFSGDDANSPLTQRTTVFDNQTQTELNFDNGFLTSSIRTDLTPSGPGGKGWDEIRSFFEEDVSAAEVESILTELPFDLPDPLFPVRLPINDTGFSLETKIVSFDNGNTRFEIFIDGALCEKVTSRVNGTVQIDRIVDGEVYATVQLDNPGSPEDSVKSWDSIVTIYGDDGALDFRRVDFDDGDITTRYVPSDPFVPPPLTSEGAGASDSLDLILLPGFFLPVIPDVSPENPVVEQIQNYDGDNSESWLVRIVTVFQDGSRALEFYDDLEDVPGYYITYADGLFPGGPPEPPIDLT